MKNNEQYKNDIKNYTIQHRPKMEPYNPDKYYGNEKASDRYYTQIVKGSIEKDKNNDEFNKNKKLYSLRKKEINAAITENKFNDQYLCVSFFESITRTVFVQKEDEEGQVSVIFTINPVVTLLSKISRDDFIDNVDRSDRFNIKIF